MPETIYYVADTVLENKSAYSQHVIKNVRCIWVSWKKC